MLLIEKKTIEENAKYIQEVLTLKSGIYIDVNYLLTHSKEVELVDIDFEYQYYLEGNIESDTLGEFFTKQGYKLIKIK